MQLVLQQRMNNNPIIFADIHLASKTESLVFGWSRRAEIHVCEIQLAKSRLRKISLKHSDVKGIGRMP